MEKVKHTKCVIGITGASGSVYARLLVHKLLTFSDVDVSIVATDNGMAVMRYEDNADWLADERLTVYDNRDFFAAPASGSARFDAMVVIPCTMGTVGRLANGVSNDLLTRAADVMLKERRKLILVPRETPLHTIHLRNLTALSECGAIVCPAMPSFYHHPPTLEAACETVIDRLVALLGLDPGAKEWGK